MTKSQKLLISLGILIVAALVLLLILKPAEAVKSSYKDNFISTSNTSTTTPVYMTPDTATATTSVSFLSQEVEQANQFIFLRASSTATVLNWRYEYSINNLDWYFESAKDAATTTITYAPQFVTHTLTFATSTAYTLAAYPDTQTRMIPLLNLNAPYMRIIYWVTGANAALFTDVITKTPDPNY